MAAPSFIAASTGAVDTGGAWSYTCAAPGAAGRLIIVQVLQDGVSATSAISVTSVTNMEDLAGTDNVMTLIASNQVVGDAPAGYQHLFCGRSLSTSAPVITGANSTTDDIYVRAYEFSNVNTGTTLASIIENGISLTANQRVDISATILNCPVTTNGPDRLACNFIAINDDNALGSFTGETGGDWTLVADYGTATGTDGEIALQTATMVSAGTIDGGSYTYADTDTWGNIGFALIGTTPSYQPRHSAMDHDLALV